MRRKTYITRVEDGHAHAKSRYAEIGVEDYINLVKDFVSVKDAKLLSLNVHLPFEIQHPDIYPDLSRGLDFIRYGEELKELYHVPLYWENSPEQVFGKWYLRYGQTTWELIPRDIELTLDTGHLMLEAADAVQARRRIEKVLRDRGDQIRHLHIHENDLMHDKHSPISKVITPGFLQKIIMGRTYIFEKGE
jgi:sugar phosphate isomerase/epimerase